MKRINVAELLKQAESKKNETTTIGTTVVVIKREHRVDPIPATDNGISQQQLDSGRQYIQEQVNKAAVHHATTAVKSDLANAAWKDYHNQKLERKKLSSKTAELVANGATEEDLKRHYSTIKGMLDQGKVLYNRAKHIEAHGSEPGPDQDTPELLVLKDRKRKLVDLRCKLQKKIETGPALRKSESKIQNWKLELDRANAEYNIIDEKLKALSA
jgi:hypothetical protein